jgi:hypothetical protein
VPISVPPEEQPTTHKTAGQPRNPGFERYKVTCGGGAVLPAHNVGGCGEVVKSVIVSFVKGEAPLSPGFTGGRGGRWGRIRFGIGRSKISMGGHEASVQMFFFDERSTGDLAAFRSPTRRL